MSRSMTAGKSGFCPSVFRPCSERDVGLNNRTPELWRFVPVRWCKLSSYGVLVIVPAILSQPRLRLGDLLRPGEPLAITFCAIVARAGEDGFELYATG